MRHVLSLLDLTSEEVRRVLEIAVELKSKMADGDRPGILENHVLGLLFEKPSLRTRVSYEALAMHLGLSLIHISEPTRPC